MVRGKKREGKSILKTGQKGVKKRREARNDCPTAAGVLVKR